MNLLKKIIPYFIKKILIEARFRFRNPKLNYTKNLYIFTDEKIKFAHILEAVNYIKVAGYGDRIPPLYFEFEEWKNYSTFGKSIL